MASYILAIPNYYSKVSRAMMSIRIPWRSVKNVAFDFVDLDRGLRFCIFTSFQVIKVLLLTSKALMSRVAHLAFEYNVHFWDVSSLPLIRGSPSLLNLSWLLLAFDHSFLVLFFVTRIAKASINLIVCIPTSTPDLAVNTWKARTMFYFLFALGWVYQWKS